MAINLDERYPGRANGKTLSYPQGSFKNRSSPTAKDGTYLEQDWANDQLAFFQSLMQQAEMSANGLVDTVEASQYFDALKSIVETATPDSTETTRGLIAIASTALAQGLTNDTVALTPKKLFDAFIGANQSLSAGGFQKFPGRFTIQWSPTGSVAGSGAQTLRTFPITFPNGPFVVLPIASSASNAPCSILGMTATGFTIVNHGASSSNFIYLAAGW
ncbi:hypothetical protein [Bordetella bronchiseptica]|uniref:gp53-like domain-containing protein n=1 Tax=Bordetella bronchiseptica TaxID=518 RepID=UPI00067D319D|nr:hypothetical protein [Bordetella bronchiseptica]